MKKIFTLLLVFALSIQLSMAQNAIDFTFTDIKGDEHNLQHALDQGFIVMIDFFFVDCPPCQGSAPEIQAIHEDYQGKNVIVWSISDRDSDAYIDQFKNNLGLTYIAGGTAGGGDDIVNTYASNFNFTGFPTIAIVCPDNSINWDIWPYTTGAPEWRNAIEACGVSDSDPYVSLNNVSTNTEDIVNAVSETIITPNPANHFANLYYNLNESADVKVSITNLLGQTIKVAYQGIQTVGRNNVDISTSDLANGTYIVNIATQDGIASSTKLVVVK